MLKPSRLIVTLLLALIPAQALAWGNTGHRFIGELAVGALPGQLPGFVRTPYAVASVGEYSREPDRSKGSGKVHDLNRDPGHFVDLYDDGTVFGGPRLSALPANRADYETALRAVGADSWKAGYLPYSIIDLYQHLTKDFAYWRVLVAAEKLDANKDHKAWMRADRVRREALILATMGQLSHMVGDGSQPLHVTIHYNGWGDFPNPQGFTQARIHGPFESDFVHANVRRADIASRLTPYRACGCPIEQRVPAYLAVAGGQVETLYQLEKSGAFATATPRGIAFAADRMAAGASELRDLIFDAWIASEKTTVGWPAVSLADVQSGKVKAYDNLYGID